MPGGERGFTEGLMMIRRKRILVLVLALGFVVLAGLGYLMFSDIDREPEEMFVARKVTPGEARAPSEERQAPPEMKKETLASLFKEETNPDGTARSSADSCLGSNCRVCWLKKEIPVTYGAH